MKTWTYSFSENGKQMRGKIAGEDEGVVKKKLETMNIKWESLTCEEPESIPQLHPAKAPVTERPPTQAQLVPRDIPTKRDITPVCPPTQRHNRPGNRRESLFFGEYGRVAQKIDSLLNDHDGRVKQASAINDAHGKVLVIVVIEHNS